MDEPYFENEYRTGRTRPQKNRNGLITLLLICVIFLGGIVSVLSLMNIHLFRQLKQVNAGTTVSFSKGDSLPADTEALGLTLEGMTFQELPVLYQQIYDLPPGLYISQVAAGSHAQALGITPGDVLLSVDDTPVTQLDTLQGLFDNTQTQVVLTIHRDGQSVTVTLRK